MNILLLDASSEFITFGLSSNGDLLSHNELNSENNADLLTYEVKSWLEKSGKSFEDIDIVSLSNGPGSFTGLRISSAIAKGICYSLDKKLVEVNTLDILANCADPDVKSKKVIPLISSNMRTGEFYFAEYEKRDKEIKRISEYKMETISSIDKSALLISRTRISESFDLQTVSKKQEMKSQNYLTLNKIKNEEFANIMISEPFYIKEFIPLKP